MSLRHIASLIALTSAMAPSYAGYYVNGPVYAEDCYNFGIKICKSKLVTEIVKDGKRYEITNYFEDVSDYSSSKKMCWKKTKSTDWGVISWGINALSQPELWGYDKDGKFGKIDAEYIYFKCEKK